MHENYIIIRVYKLEYDPNRTGGLCKTLPVLDHTYLHGFTQYGARDMQKLRKLFSKDHPLLKHNPPHAREFHEYDTIVGSVFSEEEKLSVINKYAQKDKTMNTNPIQQSTENNNSRISNVTFLKFDIEQIQIDKDSSIRFEYDPEKLQDLAESIRANNNELLQPIIITRIYANSDKDVEFLNKSKVRYNVVAGRRRFLACRDILGLKKISVIVKDYRSFESEFAAQFAENEERENWTDFDYVKAINKIKDRNKNISNQDIAKIFNKTIDWVKKKMQHLGAIQDLPESAMSHLSQIPTSHAIELKKLPKDEKEKAIAELAELAKNNLPLTTVKSIRENISRNIPVTSKKGMSVDVDKKKESSPNWKTKNYRPDINTRPVCAFIDEHDAMLAYREWKNTGSIEPEYQTQIVNDIRIAVKEIKLDLEHAKKKVSSYETELKNLISDSIALQEQQMFPVSKKKKKKA